MGNREICLFWWNNKTFCQPIHIFHLTRTNAWVELKKKESHALQDPRSVCDCSQKGPKIWCSMPQRKVQHTKWSGVIYSKSICKLWPFIFWNGLLSQEIDRDIHTCYNFRLACGMSLKFTGRLTYQNTLLPTMLASRDFWDWISAEWVFIRHIQYVYDPSLTVSRVIWLVGFSLSDVSGPVWSAVCRICYMHTYVSYTRAKLFPAEQRITKFASVTIWSIVSCLFDTSIYSSSNILLFYWKKFFAHAYDNNVTFKLQIDFD